MTISESIISWLKEFETTENEKMNQIDTEQQSPKVDSYSLVREPVQNVKRYISGRTIYTDHYTFRARLANQTDGDRIDNNAFGEALETWVREKNKKEEFPVLSEAKVQEIGITTPFYVGRTESHNSVYQMTIAIKYEKEK